LSIQAKQSLSADEIAEMATRGEAIAAFFTNRFTIERDICPVNVRIINEIGTMELEMAILDD
jgi:hypothetical protein